MNHNLALPPKTQLQNGKYTIKSSLGQGGFGITYLCEHVLMGKVVLKELFLHQACAREEGLLTVKPLIQQGEFNVFKQRFLDEARTLVKLKHIEGIVHVFDFFEENNTVYFAMEYIFASPLFDLVSSYRHKKEIVPEHLAVKIIADVSRSLKQVHAVGILHRDIKPQNILVGERLKPYLIDFGIARSFQEGQTAYHTTMATPGYSAPEQMTEEGKKSAAMDIYALGATLYFCLTQRHPQNLAEIAVNGYISAKQLNPAISDTTNNAITKAMELSQEKRFQTIDEWLAALPQDLVGAAVSQDKVPNFANQPPEDVIYADKQKKGSNRAPAPTPVPPEPQQGNPLYRRIALVGILLAIGYGSFKWLEYKDSAKSKKSKQAQALIAKANEIKSNPLEVEWVDDENSKGLTPDWQKVMFDPYDNSFSCTVTGYLKLGKIEVSRLALQMTFFDETGKQVAVESCDPIREGEGITYRSGDLIPVHHLIYKEEVAEKPWKKVKIKVDFIEKNNTNGNYKPAKPLPVKWLNRENDNYSLEIKSRLDDIDSGLNTEKSYHKMEYEITNNGNYTFKMLKLAIYYYGKGGKVLDKCERYVLNDSEGQLQPGQTRIFYSTCGFEAPKSALDHYEVVITEHR